MQGYSLCKIVSLGQKIKNETILKVGNFATAIPHAKAHTNVIALNIKNAKKFQKTILRQYYSCSLKKNPLQKTSNIREMRAF